MAYQKNPKIICATRYLHLYLQSLGSKLKMETRRDIFQAIADPTRRGIILLLTTSAMTPNALAEHFHTSRQAVSKHLQILAECDLLIQQPKGREIYYNLNTDKMKEIEKWLEGMYNM